MAGVSPQERGENSHNFFSHSLNFSNAVPIPIRDGVDIISLLVTAKDAQIPSKHPKLLKEEIVKHTTQADKIDNIYISRQGQVTITTKSIIVAQEILKIKQILNVPVAAYIQIETITSRFLLRLDSSVSCVDIAEELELQGIYAHEIRRFIRKENGSEIPTQSVLVTIYGTILPEEVKLWYQRYRIQLFTDKPRPCSKCHRYNHSSKVCRSDPLCKLCATSHSGSCTASTPCCINCKGEHAADFKQCPSYIQECKLQVFKSEHRLTLREARVQFRSLFPAQSHSYASVASASIETVKKSELNAALESVSAQFKAAIESICTEMQQLYQAFVQSITTPLMGIIKELQTKKVAKSGVAALESALASSYKRAKRGDSPPTPEKLDMDTLPAPCSPIADDLRGHQSNSVIK